MDSEISMSSVGLLCMKLGLSPRGTCDPHAVAHSVLWGLIKRLLDI